MKKKLLSLICACLAIIISISAVGCNNTTTQAQAQSFVSLDINPAIELTLDQNDNVLSVRGTNEDGQVLLYGETGLVGVNIDYAIEKITALAVELGYLSEENSVIDTIVSSKNADKLQALQDKVNAKITAKARGLGITVETTGKGVYSLLRKLEQFKAEYPDNEIIQNLTVEQFRLALSASETGEVTLECAVEMSTEELIKLISDTHKAMKDYATDAYRKAKAKAENEYEKALGEVIDGIYQRKGIINGTLYKAYKTMARTLDGIAKIMHSEVDIGEHQISESAVTGIMAVLNIDDVSVLKNSDGIITLESIYDYVDKIMKNLSETEAEQLKTAIDAALDEIESAVDDMILTVGSEYETQINELIGVVKGFLATIDSNPWVAEKLSEINALIEELEQALIGGITYEEIHGIAQEFDAKAQAIKTQIENQLNKADRNDVNNIIEQAIQGITNHKDAFQNKIDYNMQQAKDRLEQLKNGRR